MSGSPFRSTLFEVGPLSAIELMSDDILALQEFFDANPEYFFAVNGVAPRSNEAFEEFHDPVPAEMSFTKVWRIGIFNEAQTMVGMASVVSDLIAPRVWHIGLFIIATSLHGSGVAAKTHDALVAWMQRGGAAWIRLGVVEGNVRAEQFWAQRGYREVRKRHGVEMGAKANTLRVMVKSFACESLETYLAIVARDRTE